jgi:hypothetical protein
MHRYVVRCLRMFPPNLSQLSPITGRRHERAAAMLLTSKIPFAADPERGSPKFPCDQ